MRPLPCPALRFPKALVFCALGACGPAAAPPVAAPPAPVAAAAPLASPAPAAPPAAPVAAPPAKACDARVLGLAFGKTLDDRSEEVKRLPPTEGPPLAALLPDVAAEGWEIETIVAILLGDDATARALVLHKPLAEDESAFGARATWLGVATCTPERGYALAAKPLSLHDGTSVLVWDTERVTPPGAPPATAITLAMGGMGLEFHAAAFLLGKGSPPFPVQAPKGEAVGQLGVFGNVAQQYLIDGGGESYARVDRAGGTGFYPLGDDLAFFALRHEMGSTRGVIQGLLTPKGVVRADSGPAVESYAVLGKGEPPAFCGGPGAAGKVRCARLELPSSQGTLAFDWIAGLWPTAEATDAALLAFGADPKKLDYLLVGASDDASPPKGPGGKRPLTFLRAKTPKK